MNNETNETETRATVSTGVAARIIGVHRDTVSTYVDRGLVDGYALPSGHRRVYLDSLSAYASGRWKAVSDGAVDRGQS